MPKQLHKVEQQVMGNQKPNLGQDHINSSLRQQDISSKYPSNRQFTPLGQAIESALKELLEHNLIILPNKTTWGCEFLSNYCAYHRHNKHNTLDCMELKHKIQDLLDNGIIEIEDPNDSSIEK